MNWKAGEVVGTISRLDSGVSQVTGNTAALLALLRTAIEDQEQIQVAAPVQLVTDSRAIENGTGQARDAAGSGSELGHSGANLGRDDTGIRLRLNSRHSRHQALLVAQSLLRIQFIIPRLPTITKLLTTKGLRQ
jgi:hypothetical protein